MPVIRVKGLDKDVLDNRKFEIIDCVSTELNIPSEHFKLEYIDVIQLMGAPSATFDIDIFEKERDILDKTANVLTKLIKTLCKKDIVVYFNIIDRNKFYLNGNPKFR